MADGRDRDAEGRARNARPRDASGRPLPRGAQGVHRVEEDEVLPPDEVFARAQDLLDGDRPFDAHDVLEGAWKAAADAEDKLLFKGLAQLAVGLTHEQRGNARGAAALLRRGAETIAEAPDAAARHGVDVRALAGWAAAREASGPLAPGLVLRRR